MKSFKNLILSLSLLVFSSSCFFGPESKLDKLKRERRQAQEKLDTINGKKQSDLTGHDINDKSKLKGKIARLGKEIEEAEKK